MSWEAVAWANKQRLRLPQEQLVLLVLANCADPDGVAFAQWRGKEHWWKYLCERTRLSRASVYRHLARIEELGLGSRSTIILADGTKRPIIALDFEQTIDESDKNEAANEPESESHHETESHSETDEADESLTVRLDESHGETPSLDSNICSKDSPRNPPPGGLPARIDDDRFEEFAKAWGAPIPLITHAQAAWSKLPTERHGEAIAAAKGYWAWLKAQSKPPSPQSAQTFLRAPAGFAQWLPYVPAEDGTATSATGAYRVGSREGLAIVMAYRVAGADEALASFVVKRGTVYYNRPISPRLMAFATIDRPRDEWPVLNHQQAVAWEQQLREIVPIGTRHRLKEGSRAPWLWPPSAEGKTYTATGTPPTVPELSDEDEAEFR